MFKKSYKFGEKYLAKLHLIKIFILLNKCIRTIGDAYAFMSFGLIIGSLFTGSQMRDNGAGTG